MEALWLLAKINVAFQIAEKIAWGLVGLWVSKTGIHYYRDYKESVQTEKYIKERR